jgi:hypothetical protein
MARLTLLALWASTGTAASPWIEITSEDFVLVTNLSEKQARTLLRDFEVFQFGASRLLVGEDTQPKIPTYLFALSSRDFEAIVDSKDLAGLFVGRQFANFVLYDHGQRGVQGREVVFHEYLHFLLHNSPGFIYPATGRRARDLYRSLLADPVAHDEASLGFARAAMLLDKPGPDEVLAVIRPATAHLPTSTDLAQVEALFALRTGDNQLARDAATRAVRYANSFEERKSMQSLLDRIEQRIAAEAR